jgi:general secretion pathway protein K
MRDTGTFRSGRQRGVALLVVLWACTLLAILLGGFAMLARTEGLQARYQFAQTQAHYAAEAGVTRAIWGVQDPVAPRRWRADGRPYTFRYGDATVRVSLTDEGGKVDLNSAAPEVLQALFHAAGVDDAAARALTGAVIDWRSYAPVASAPSAGADYRPRHAPFASIEELQQVRGMTPALYQRIAAQITIWSGRESPDPDSAPPFALAAIPGMTPQQAAQITAARQGRDPGVGLSSSNAATQSIRSEATLADGTRAVLRATVRLRGARSGIQPYAVLHWQEGDGE